MYLDIQPKITKYIFDDFWRELHAHWETIACKLGELHARWETIAFNVV